MATQRWLVVAELAAFGGIITGHTLGVLPLSSTPFLLLLVWASLHRRSMTWRQLGVCWPQNTLRDLSLGCAAGALLFCWGMFVQEPFFDALTGQTQDLSQFENLKGNVGFLIVMLILNWLLAAAGEETVYRGYLLNRLTDLFGTTRPGWAAALVCGAILFGAAHVWQGVSGVLDASVMGVWYGLLYLSAGRNLVVPAAAHGINNTIGLVLIYLGYGH